MARSNVFKHDKGIPLPKSFKGGRSLDRDRLMMLPRSLAANAANLGLFQLQDETPEEIMAGCAVMFTAMCRRCRMDPQDMVSMANWILNAPDEGDHVTGNSLDVLRDFIGGRLMNETVTIG